MTRQINLNFKKILESGEYLVKNISEPDLAYLRVWARRNKLFVSKIKEGEEINAFVSVRKDDGLQKSIIDFIAQGRKFTLENVRVGYVRECVSALNKKNGTKWKVSKINSTSVLIYPDPLTDETQNELI